MDGMDIVVIVSLFLCLLLGYIIGVIVEFGDTKELAQSICDQEYNMDFDSYNNKELKCQPKEAKAKVQYDGIVIQIIN